MPASTRVSRDAQEPLEARNEVLVVGRLSAPAQERVLPSGDVIATWRVIVDRPVDRPVSRPSAGGAGRAQQDTVECVAWRAGLRRAALRWAPGELVHVEGALRRRFWRGPGGVSSRYEIEVGTARRVVPGR
jgi:single-strand DNA-binding protein